MIYIYDNGEQYSAHEIYFIETAWPKDVVEKVMTTVNEGCLLLGAAPSVEWYVDKAHSLEDFCGRGLAEALQHAGLPSELVKSAITEELAYLTKCLSSWSVANAAQRPYVLQYEQRLVTLQNLLRSII